MKLILKKATASAATLFASALFVMTLLSLTQTNIASRTALKQLTAAVIRPWSNVGPHPPASAASARLVPPPNRPAMLWLINRSSQIHETGLTQKKEPAER